MQKKLIAYFVLLLIAAGILQFSFDTKYNYSAKKQLFINLPSGQTLKILSFGYENLMADLIYLWSIQLFSSYSIENRFDHLEHIFNIITDLNPRYYDPYIVGSWIMALEKKDIPMAMRLLDKGAKHITDKWQLDHELGFYAYETKDYDRAEKYFKRAELKSNAPPMLKRRRAHMAYMNNDLKKAFRLWLEIFQRETEQIAKDSAYYHLYQIKYELDKILLEKKIQQYKQIYRRYPNHLQALQKKSLLTMIPKDLKNEDYIYNSRTGKIKAKRIFKWKKLL